MVIGVNCGHTISGTIGGGALGYLNESNETRAVGNALIRMLEAQGNKVINCTDDYADSVTENLARICELANAQPLDIFLSIHFNAGGGAGTEAYTFGAADTAYAGDMTAALQRLGFRNRGIKDGSHLYVVRNTQAPACLLEVCFVDTKSDADLYQNLGAERIAAALCEAVTGSAPDIGGEELSMAQYEELSGRITELAERVSRLENPMIYNYVDGNMPEWARETVTKLIEKEVLRGDGEGLALTDDMLRILVINDRAGLYD